METVTKTFNVYRTPEGIPTCARNTINNDVCEFFGSTLFGQREVCMYKNTIELDRDDLWLKPHPDCPFWR